MLNDPEGSARALAEAQEVARQHSYSVNVPLGVPMHQMTPQQAESHLDWLYQHAADLEQNYQVGEEHMQGRQGRLLRRAIWDAILKGEEEHQRLARLGGVTHATSNFPELQPLPGPEWAGARRTWTPEQVEAIARQHALAAREARLVDPNISPMRGASFDPTTDAESVGTHSRAVQSLFNRLPSGGKEMALGRHVKEHVAPLAQLEQGTLPPDRATVIAEADSENKPRWQLRDQRTGEIISFGDSLSAVRADQRQRQPVTQLLERLRAEGYDVPDEEAFRRHASRNVR